MRGRGGGGEERGWTGHGVVALDGEGGNVKMMLGR